MQIIIRADEHQVGYVAADIIGTYVVDGAVLGLATGSSPLATYQELIRRCSRGELSFKGCSAYLLDEYVGIHREDPNSYYRTIREEFSAYIDIDDAQVFSPDSTDPDPNSAARRYEEQVVAAGVDVQVLGIGANGHIAFNEPMSSLAGKTTVQALHPLSLIHI